jgi:hypothetical protein
MFYLLLPLKKPQKYLKLSDKVNDCKPLAAGGGRRRRRGRGGGGGCGGGGGGGGADARGGGPRGRGGAVHVEFSCVQLAHSLKPPGFNRQPLKLEM